MARTSIRLWHPAPGTDDFGRKCLLAPRLVEAGVRCVEISHGDWKIRSTFNLTTALGVNCRSVDQPIGIVPTFEKGRIARFIRRFALRFPRRGWMDCRSSRIHERPSDSNTRNAHRLKASGRLRSAATAQLSGRSSNRPGWNGFNARCSSRKKSAFVLPFRFPFNVWQSNA